MNKNALLIIISGVIVMGGIIWLGASSSGSTVRISNGTSAENSVMKDGIQYVTINARGGYTPKVSTAKAGIPTKLIVKTNGTYDCSASLVIRSLGYQKILSQNGEEVIDIGTPKAGVPLQGVCGMGMYSFLVNFS